MERSGQKTRDSARMIAAAPDAPPKEDGATTFFTASHADLLAAEAEVRCDACGGELPAEDEETYALRGEGEYVWTRGDEVRRESAPLCPACATAIFGAALARWEIEEEEG